MCVVLYAVLSSTFFAQSQFIYFIYRYDKRNATIGEYLVILSNDFVGYIFVLLYR